MGQLQSETDILVIGAGGAGLSAAVALAKSGFQVAVVGTLEQPGGGRTVALFEASLRFYDALGLWPQLAPHAAKIVTIRMIDATHAAVPIPGISFSAAEIGLPAFGENIENDHLAGVLAEVARTIPSLSMAEERLVDIMEDGDHLRAVFTSGRSIAAKLIVAADGQRSTVRAKARIGARRWTYPQVAMTVLTGHEKPHRNVSVEFHTRSGPCTLVPLPSAPDAPHRSSLVWLMTRAEAERRRNLADEALAKELEAQVQSIFGRMRFTGSCGTFPMMGLSVTRLTGRRVALLGEAAHAFPPLAAQGLNLSLRDTAALVACVEAARDRGEDIGGRAALAAYAAARRPDISLRTHGIDILNRSLLADFFPVDLARGASFLAFNMVGPLRRAIMREGILPDEHLPPLMRRPRTFSVEHPPRAAHGKDKPARTPL